MANTKNWEEIPIDMAVKIAEHLEFYDDYESFARVCSTWRLAIKNSPHQYMNKMHTQLPWLMLVDPDDSPYRRYYSLTKRKFLKIDLPPSVIGTDNYKDDQIRRYFSSRGWLISVTQNNRRITLFNPFSKIVIETPELPIEQFDTTDGEWEDWMLRPYFHKFVLSMNPTNCNDFVMLMIYEGDHRLAFWRPGQNKWIKLAIYTGWCMDAYFFQDQFYTICNRGIVMEIGGLNNIDHNKEPRIVVDLGSLGLISILNMDKLYLVESKSETGETCLLVVYRKSYLTKRNRYGTISFQVFEINVENGDVKEVKTLGNRAIFVGFNSTFSVMAFPNSNDERGCKADCIYYTDDNYEVYGGSKKGGGQDMGMYSMALGKSIHYRHPHRYDGSSRFSLINPPTWLEFPDELIGYLDST